MLRIVKKQTAEEGVYMRDELVRGGARRVLMSAGGGRLLQ